MTEQEEFEFRDRLEKEQGQGQKQSGYSDIIPNAGKDIGGILETTRRTGQGIMDLPSDVYQTGKQMAQGQSFTQTPIGQDVNTVGNAALEALPHGVNENGSYKVEPGSIFRQYQDLTAQPLKYIPGKIGQTMKQAYPGNPLIEHPVNSALAAAPLFAPAESALREIPAVDEGLSRASQSLRKNYVAPNARRALGKFPMKMPVEEANQVGLDAVDQGVIRNPLTNPLSSGRKSMLGRATDINESLGENIGAFLKGQGEGLESTRAMQELDSIKAKFMNDPQIVAKVDNAKELIDQNSSQPVQDVMAVNKVPQKMEFSPANKLKGLFQNKVNYFSDAANQQAGKSIASNFRNSIDTQLDELTSKLGNREGMQQFKSDKKMFSSTRKMEDALTGQVNRDARNMPVSLPSVGVGIGGFIKGGGVKGLLSGMVAEWTKRYGSATAASIMNDVSKALEGGVLPEVSPSIGAAASVANPPHGKTVRQNGKTYKWNGSEYIEQ